MSLYRLIDEESDRQHVSRLCRTLGVTRSGYYDWQRQPLSDRALADWLLTEQMRGIFAESEQTYGSPRVFNELKLGHGMQIGEKRVARLMRQAGLRSIHAKKQNGSTTRAAEHPLAPDLVGRDFDVDGPDRLWVADFTQLTTWRGTCKVVSKVRIPYCNVYPEQANCRLEPPFFVNSAECSGLDEKPGTFTYSRFSCNIRAGTSGRIGGKIAVWPTGPTTLRGKSSRS